jgi:hypothetical protein
MCVTNYVATADTIDVPDVNPHHWIASGAVDSTCLSINVYIVFLQSIDSKDIA